MARTTKDSEVAKLVPGHEHSRERRSYERGGWNHDPRDALNLSFFVFESGFREQRPPRSPGPKLDALALYRSADIVERGFQRHDAELETPVFLGKRHCVGELPSGRPSMARSMSERSWKRPPIPFR